MASGNGYVEEIGRPGIRRAPGTSFTLLPAYLVFGRSLAAGRIWFCLLSALTCVLTGWLGRRCFGPVVGLLSAAWLAVYPGHFYYAMHFMSETPFALWLVLALGFTITPGRERSWRSDALAGLCWGMTVLTRPGMVFMLPIAALAVLAARGGRRRWLATLAVQTALAAVVVAPWIVRNAVVFGKPALTTVGGHTFYGANNEQCLNNRWIAGKWIPTSSLHSVEKPVRGNEIERERLAWRYGWEFVRGNLKHMPYLAMMKVYRVLKPVHSTPNQVIWWTFTIGWLTVVPFLLIGLVHAWRRYRAVTVVLLLPLFALLAQTVVFYGIGRFRDARAPAFIVLAALGLHIVARRIRPGPASEAGAGEA